MRAEVEFTDKNGTIFTAIVSYDEIKIDESFSHAFGIEECYSIEREVTDIDECYFIDDDGNVVEVDGNLYIDEIEFELSKI
jgi:hypothetical protein